jgi:hypothetical protein
MFPILASPGSWAIVTSKLLLGDVWLYSDLHRSFLLHLLSEPDFYGSPTHAVHSKMVGLRLESIVE